MTKNSKAVLLSTIFLVFIAMFIVVGRDLFLRRATVVSCADGSHPRIDIRDFTTQYWAYSAKLEVSVEKTKASAQLEPNLLAQVSQALQESTEFRKYIVAGYNSCAITPAQYARFGSQFEALDQLAREIDSLLSKSSLSPEDHSKVDQLVTQYIDLTHQLGSR